MTSPHNPDKSPQLDPRRWAEIRAAVEAALELPPERRVGFLHQRLMQDDALHERARALLSACEGAADPAAAFLAEPAGVFAAPLLEGLSAGSAREQINGDPSAVSAAASWKRSALDTVRARLSDRYDVERELGRGGTATVYLARDVRHGRRVAIKVLDPLVGAGLSGERFLREIRVTAGLTHPHILPLHDSGEAAGLLYYIMPYVEGETLRERLARDRSLPVRNTLRLLREVADALAYAHRRGVVHRDIKPANILLHDGHALVADFGIARAVYCARTAPDTGTTDASGQRTHADASNTLTAAGVSPGTPAYMAPEQASGEPIDERADLYALGVVGYEMLTGTHPFGARTAGALVDAHKTEPPPTLPLEQSQAPPPLAALVLQLLAKNPADRPPNADAVLHMLEMIPATSARTAVPRRAVVLTSVALLLLITGVGYVAGRRGLGSGNPARNSSTGSNTASSISANALAVLPFVNTSGEPENEYFSDGLTDELAHALARLPGVRLAGRTSSYAFKGKQVSAREIGRALGVSALVNGTVRRTGTRVRVSAQLVSTADETVRWDSVFESQTGDVFAVQDELTRAMVAALAPALRGGADTVARRERGTADPEAYELYLKGHYYFLLRGVDNVRRAIDYFQEAIERDANFARAYAGLAMAYRILPIYIPVRRDSIVALMAASARRAVALDSTLSDAQLVMGQTFEVQLRFWEALSSYRAAVTLDASSATAHLNYGFCLMNVGRTEDALVELNRALQLDPLVKSAASAVTLGYLSAHRFPEAIAAARHAFALDSTFQLAIFVRGLAQEFGGQPDSAIRTLERGTRLYPADSRLLTFLALAYAASGRWADAQRIREQLHRPGTPLLDGTEAARADLVFGDPEPLLRILTSPEGLRRYVLAGGVLGCNPLQDPLWADARFRATMRRLGVATCSKTRPWPILPRPPDGVSRS